MQEQSAQFHFSQEYAHQTELHGLEGRPCSFGEGVHYGPQWAILKFDQPVTAPHVSAPNLAMSFASIHALYIQPAHPVSGKSLA